MELRWFKEKESPRLLLQTLIGNKWTLIPIEYEDASEEAKFLKMMKKPKTLAIYSKKKPPKKTLKLPIVEKVYG